MGDKKIYETCKAPFTLYVDGIMKKRDYSYNELLRGICTQDEWNIYSHEDRFMGSLLIKRILERLGDIPVYYDYLAFGTEYDKWKNRMDVLLAIDKGDFENANLMLDAYDYTNDKLEYQFYLMMKSIIMKPDCKNKDELLSLYEMAALQTIPDGVDVKLGKENCILCAQEINILLEYYFTLILNTLHNLKENCKANQYIYKLDEILAYIQKAEWDASYVAQIYPKAIYYHLYLEEMMFKECDITTGNFCEFFNMYSEKIKKCNCAIDILGKAEGSYYLAELLDMRKEYAAKLQKMISSDMFEKLGYKAASIQTENLHNIQKYIKEITGVCPYMQADTYMYVEMSVFRLEDAVISRRKAMGMSQAKLADGICDVKTVGRFERGEHIPRTYILYGILRKVKLYSNFVVGGIIAFSNVEYEKMGSINLLISQEKFDEALACLDELKSCLDMSYEKNVQMIEKNQNMIFLRKGIISKQEYLKKIKQILGYTVDYNCMVNMDKLYLTSDEVLLIQNMLSINCDADNLKILQKICCFYESEGEILHANRYRLFSATVASQLANRGEFGKSDKIFTNIIAVNAKLKRWGYTARCIYGLWWNMDAQNKSTVYEKQEILEMCIDISEFVKDYKFSKYFKNQKNIVLENHM